MLLYFVRVMLATVFLAYAAYRDYRAREVNDEVWLLGGSIAVPLLVYDYLFLDSSNSELILLFSSLVIASLVAYGFYKAGMYGGADAKAVVFVALSTPLNEGLSYIGNPFLPVSMLLNGLVFSLVIPLSLASLNAYRLFVKKEKLFEGFEQEPRLRKFIVVFLGTKIRDPKRYEFWGSLEHYDSSGRRRFLFSTSLSRFESELKPNSWATPGIPLLIFLFAGYVVAVLFGDVIFVSLL